MEDGGIGPIMGETMGSRAVMEHRITSRRWKRRARGVMGSNVVEHSVKGFGGKRKSRLEVGVVIPLEIDKNAQRRRVEPMEIEEGRMMLSSVAGPTEWTLGYP